MLWIYDYSQEIWIMSTTRSPLSKSKTPPPQRIYQPMVSVPLLLVQEDACKPPSRPISGSRVRSKPNNLNTRRLRQFDQSHQSKITSQATTPPRSVVGIGGKGALLSTRGELCSKPTMKVRSQTTRRQRSSSLWYLNITLLPTSVAWSEMLCAPSRSDYPPVANRI